MNIKYSSEAVDDLIRLREFIAVKNPYAAKHVSERLLSGINKLKVFPKMGLPVQQSPEPEKNQRFIYHTLYSEIPFN